VVLDRPRLQMVTRRGVVGGGAPPGVPRPRPPWFSSDEQYEEFLKRTAHDLGAQSITATSIDVEHLDEDHRKELLAACPLRPTVEFVCETFARLDDAALFSRDSAFEKQFVRGLTGDLARRVQKPLANGSRLMPPAAMTQLIREVIEWCPDTTASGADDTHPTLGINDFVHLVLSINGDQERQDRPDFFQTWPPSDDETGQYYEAMSVDDEMVLREVQRQMLSGFARMQANAITVPDLVLGDTRDTWFKDWPKAAPHDLIGDTPEDAFLAATGVSLCEFIKLGQLLWERTKTGELIFTAASLEGSADSHALDLMRNAASLTVDDYRKRLARERRNGFLAHRRYTFTERPLLRIGDDEFIALRPAWVLDRFCGSQLYWQNFFDFGLAEDPRGEQFSQAMNYVFEASVGYLFRRVARRGRPAITLITEEQMQQAWMTGGNKPSVCDWVLVSGRYCLLVDATNHWLDEKAAQGFADVEDYQADTEETFVNKKFQQLKSTIELLAKNGWGGCTFDDQTIYVPLVIVPNAGIPATVLSDVDFKLRSHSVLGQLGKIVTSPGILIYRELQVFEGLSEHRVRRSFVEVLARWRLECTKSMPIRPQTFLDLAGADRPMSTYPSTARSMLLKRLRPNTR
jgi:hypothetical protein